MIGNVFVTLFEIMQWIALLGVIAVVAVIYVAVKGLAKLVPLDLLRGSPDPFDVLKKKDDDADAS